MTNAVRELFESYLIVSLRDIYDEVAAQINADPWSRKYQHSIRGIISTLRQRGEIYRVSRGVWRKK